MPYILREGKRGSLSSPDGRGRSLITFGASLWSFSLAFPRPLELVDRPLSTSDASRFHLGFITSSPIKQGILRRIRSSHFEETIGRTPQLVRSRGFLVRFSPPYPLKRSETFGTSFGSNQRVEISPATSIASCLMYFSLPFRLRLAWT